MLSLYSIESAMQAAQEEKVVVLSSCEPYEL